MADNDGTTLKLCDFGLSIMKSADMRSECGNYFVGSLLWMVSHVRVKDLIFALGTGDFGAQ